MDWNDLRLFLAVARLGSIRAAAGELGLNQSTINRRMDVLEHDLRLTLFDRTTRGLALTEAGQAVAAAARPLQAEVAAIGALAARLARQAGGMIKVTAPQTTAVLMIAPLIAEFSRRHPDILVEYDGAEEVLDLHAGEADVAFRAGAVPPDASLHADLVVNHRWAVYCSTARARLKGIPHCVEDLRRFDVVALGGAIGKGPGNLWFMQQVDPRRITGVASSVPNMAHILHAGLGVGILPTLTGDQERGLQRCFDPIPELTTHMWLVTTPEARRVPRVAALVGVALEWFKEFNKMMANKG